MMNNYSCPTCGTPDANQYVNCFHPMCPDGRDPRPSNWKTVELKVMYQGLPTDWVASCGVCGSCFAIREEHVPSDMNLSIGTFCPDCKANGLKAPGVLNWRRRNDLEMSKTK